MTEIQGDLKAPGNPCPHACGRAPAQGGRTQRQHPLSDRRGPELCHRISISWGGIKGKKGA